MAPGNGYKYAAQRALANRATRSNRNRNKPVGPSPLRKQIFNRSNTRKNNRINAFANDPRLSHYTRNFLARLRSELKPGEPIDPGFYAFVQRVIAADLEDPNVTPVNWTVLNTQ
jgi:hypothetical protein